MIGSEMIDNTDLKGETGANDCNGLWQWVDSLGNADEFNIKDSFEET